VRRLYEAAFVILTRPLKAALALKSWAIERAKRACMKKATVALARKLAVIMHRMLADGTPFTTQPGSAVLGHRQGRARVCGGGLKKDRPSSHAASCMH
jgi:hypothetical protein